MSRRYPSVAEAVEPSPITVTSTPSALGDVVGAVARCLVAGGGLALIGLSVCVLVQAPAWYWLAALVSGFLLSGALAVGYGVRDAAALAVCEWNLRQADAEIDRLTDWVRSLERQRTVDRIIVAPRASTSAWVEPVERTDPVERDARELLERQYVTGLPASKRHMMDLGWTEARHRAAVTLLRHRGMFSGNNWRTFASAEDALKQFEGER